MITSLLLLNLLQESRNLILKQLSQLNLHIHI